MLNNNQAKKPEGEPSYRNIVSPQLMNQLKERIINVVVIQKKYKDKNYTARQLATDLGTNTRYVSAVLNERFNMNYTSFVNKYRVEEAMAVLLDTRYEELRMQEVSDMVGFSNRQSFYTAFFKFTGMTPKEYRMKHMTGSRAKKKGKKTDDANS